MRSSTTIRLFLGAMAGLCLLIAAAAPAAADDAPPGDTADLNPPPLPAPLVEPPPQAGTEAEAKPVEGDEKPVDAPPADAPAVPDAPPTDGAAAVVEEGDVPAFDPAAVEVQPETTPARRRLRRRLPVSGSLRFNYRLRSDGDETDNDLYQYLILDVGHDNQCGWSYSFHGRLTEDLDGRSDKSEFFVFDSITDTYKSRINGRVYHLYANYRMNGGRGIRQVRIGRQYVEAGEFLTVDGARVDFGDMAGTGGFGASVFAGVPTHLFEAWPQGDLTFGASIYGMPWRGAQARLDYVYIDDESNYYGTETAHLVTATLRQQINRYVSLWGAYQHLNDDPRTLRLAGSASVPSQDMFVRAAFFSQLSTQNQRVIDLDPYFAIAQSYEPYWTGDVSLSKGIGERVYVEGGVALRRLYSESDEGTFNREYSRYWIAGSLDDWPLCNSSITLTGERWESDDDAYTVTADFEYKPSKRFKLQIGTDYSAYRFDFYTAGERQSVRGYYVRVVWRTSEKWRWHLRCRLEDDKFDTYVTLNTGFQVEF